MRACEWYVFTSVCVVWAYALEDLLKWYTWRLLYTNDIVYWNKTVVLTLAFYIQMFQTQWLVFALTPGAAAASHRSITVHVTRTTARINRVFMVLLQETWCYCNVERSGSGVELRTLDYENPGSNPGCCVKTLGKFFHSTLLQYTQLNKNEYLAIGSGGYVYEQHMAGCFPEKPRWCLSEQVCQGSKV